MPPYLRGFPNNDGVVTLAVGITTTTAIFEGLVIQEEFPEVVSAGLEPICDAELSQRPFAVLAPLAESPFNEPPIPEGAKLTPITVVCNRPLSAGFRYSGLLFYVRLDEDLRSTNNFLLDLISGVQGVISQGRCIDRGARSQLRSLSRAAGRAYRRGQAATAVSLYEDIARFAQNNAVEGIFDNCPQDANYEGFIKSRALITAGQIFDRALNPDPNNRVPYTIPPDITVPPLP